MKMVERVARALCTQHYEKRFAPIKGNPHAPHIMMNVEGNWHLFVDPARVAIEAMKEPTGHMTAEAWGRINDVRQPDDPPPLVGCRDIYVAMIQAALEEGE